MPELVLTYRGRIPAKKSDRDAVWQMRQCFSKQLENIWKTDDFDTVRSFREHQKQKWDEKIGKKFGDQEFIPLFSNEIGLGVQLEIELLTGLPLQKSVVKSGDLDNRIKRIIDALRAPQQKGELSESFSEQEVFTLMKDDDIVMRLSAKSGVYLDSYDSKESFVIIRVQPKITKALTSFLHLGL